METLGSAGLFHTGNITQKKKGCPKLPLNFNKIISGRVCGWGGWMSKEPIFCVVFDVVGPFSAVLGQMNPLVTAVVFWFEDFSRWRDPQSGSSSD